jgi:hypothetical protein
MKILQKQSQKNIEEIIAIVKGVRRHLVEPKCSHGIDFIVKEALENKNNNAGLSAQQQTDSSVATSGPTKNGSENINKTKK